MSTTDPYTDYIRIVQRTLVEYYFQDFLATSKINVDRLSAVVSKDATTVPPVCRQVACYFYQGISGPARVTWLN